MRGEVETAGHKTTGHACRGGAREKLKGQETEAVRGYDGEGRKLRRTFMEDEGEGTGSAARGGGTPEDTTGGGQGGN